MKNKEFCPSDMISLLVGAFDSDNGNLLIKKTANKLVELSDAGAKFYGKIAVVPSENGKYQLQTEGYNGSFANNDIKTIVINKKDRTSMSNGD